MSNGKKVGVVGSGLVGKSWAMIFASQGYQVTAPMCINSLLISLHQYFINWQQRGTLIRILKPFIF